MHQVFEATAWALLVDDVAHQELLITSIDGTCSQMFVWKHLIFLLQLNVYACLKGFNSTELSSINDFEVPRNIQCGGGEYGVKVNYKSSEM